MFAALILVRLREAAWKVEGLMGTSSWVSGDEVVEVELPLARATEKVLASMHTVLERTKEKRDEEWEGYRRSSIGKQGDEQRDKLMQSKAAEVRLVRNVGCLRNPEVRFKADRV